MDASRYENHGLSFLYPEAWELDEVVEEGAITITLSTSQTGFWSVTIMTDRPSVDEVLQASLDAFEESYPGMDRTSSEVHVGGRPGRKEELDFICHDLVSSAELLAVRTGRLTALVMSQYYDQEEDDLKPIFDQITKSLAFDPGDHLAIT